MSHKLSDTLNLVLLMKVFYELHQQSVFRLYFIKYDVCVSSPLLFSNSFSHETDLKVLIPLYASKVCFVYDALQYKHV